MKWAPRSGRSKTFKLWMHDMLDRLGDMGYESIEEVLKLQPPTKDALTQNAADGAERRATRATNADELYTQALEEFQAINGQIHNIVYPSLIFTGPHEEGGGSGDCTQIPKGRIEERNWSAQVGAAVDG